MPYPPTTLDADLLNETDAESGVDDAAALEAEGGVPGEGEHAERHNLSAEAINDIVAELGANPSGGEATVQARLEALGLTLASKADSAAVTEALAAKASKAELAAEESARVSGLAGKASTAALAAEESARVSGLAGKAPTVHEHPQYDPSDLLPFVIPPGMWPFTTIEPVAKRAFFLRFTVSRKRTLKFVRFPLTAVGTGEDKIDVGIFGVNGAKLERLGSSGGVKTLTTPVRVIAQELTSSVVCEPGLVYFVAMSWETKTGTPQVAAMNNNNALYGDIGGTGTLANRFQVFKAETFPLGEKIEGFTGTPCPWLVPSES